VNRELLLEIGCEELPASWLPGLTNLIGDLVQEQLRSTRLAPEAPVETFSTPRRLTAWVERVPERQADLEELVTGPPVSASFATDGTATPAARGFAAKQGVDVSSLERVTTAKGEYLAFRKRQRGKAAVDVLPDVLSGTLRGLTFPKLMRWDAVLEDGRGELLFGRPIRWILYSYGGRLVPFTIGRTTLAQSDQVQAVTSGTVTYGHRFLATSGRAGRAVKVKSFEEYRTRLRENFVILERGERHDKIARELDAKAQRLKGRVSRTVHLESALLDEVPDLVEYPSVIAGTFSSEFTEVLPDEVLTTTLIHHQHYFPVEDEEGRLKPAFLAVVNTEPENERTIAVNAERVVTARLRDAMFFWSADRRTTLEAKRERLSTLLFHKKVGSYLQKADRIERLAEWIAREAFGASADETRQAGLAARLAKADLTTDMVRELTELQGIMGGIYAREEGFPEEVWKAIYFHYLPSAVGVDAAPRAAQLGKAAATWAAVSLADKLDTIAGLFLAGERPTGSRDPYALRRAAHGVCKILVDLPDLVGRSIRPDVQTLIDAAQAGFDVPAGNSTNVEAIPLFMVERLAFVLESRGFDIRNVRAVTLDRDPRDIRPADELRKLKLLPEFTSSADFQQLAVAFKRVRNIARGFEEGFGFAEMNQTEPTNLSEPAEVALFNELKQRGPVIDQAVQSGDQFRAAFSEAAKFKPAVDRFFTDVLVMAPDTAVRTARLRLMRRLEGRILKLADISQIVAEDSKPA
jgi:glycyl-tRNA synthetase beta chain